MPLPRPGPSPTPTPIPVHAIHIGSLEARSDGSALLTPAAGCGNLEPFIVDKDYMDTCQPSTGGYYVVFPDVTCYMSATAYETMF